MFKRRYVALLPSLRIACCPAARQNLPETQATTGTSSGGSLEPQHNVMQISGDFANNPNAQQQFIDKMVSKHVSTVSAGEILLAV